MKRTLHVVAVLVLGTVLSGCDAVRSLVDLVPPVVTVLVPPVDGTPVLGDELTFQLSVLDVSEIVAVRYETPAGAVGTCTGSRANGFTCDSVPITFGLVEVTFTAEDAVGLVGTASRTVLKVTPSTGR